MELGDLVRYSPDDARSSGASYIITLIPGVDKNKERWIDPLGKLALVLENDNLTKLAKIKFTESGYIMEVTLSDLELVSTYNKGKEYVEPR